MRTGLVAALGASLLLLAGCEEEAVPEADTVETGGDAAGEVLGGTISDDMIALESLTSTSPPAARPRSEGGSGESAPDGGGEPVDETAEAEASGEDAPASEPADEE